MTRIQARKPLSRRATNLSANIDRRLLGYATAAAAAGVGTLALVQPAEAKIVYTPANIPITVNGPVVQLDLNQDGIIDFSFINYLGFGDCTGDARHGRANVGHPNTLTCTFAHLKVVGAQSGNAIGSSQTFNGAQCAAELRIGHMIEAGRKFTFNAYMFDSSFAPSNGFQVANIQNCPWRGKDNRGGFLGLQFVAGGQTFYGWARVTLTPTGPVLSGYAYDDTPNHPIGAGERGTGSAADASHPSDIPTPAPQPATLGLLASGVFGLNAWRRHEK